ncbi:MAG TPA: roadblock/LC7 domain-containing protein [Gemmatimonadales bacterium]
MPTIRDVVKALHAREGVEAVIVLGRDGLTIDAVATDGLDTEGLAALVPSVVASCTRLGSAATRGDFTIGAVEYGNGLIVIAALSSDALLAMLVGGGTNIGGLLYELHRHKPAIAGLL